MKPPFDAVAVLAVLGPAFLVAGAWRLLRPRRTPLQGRVWLLVGTLFCAVAWYLVA